MDFFQQTIRLAENVVTKEFEPLTNLFRREISCVSIKKFTNKKEMPSPSLATREGISQK